MSIHQRIYLLSLISLILLTPLLSHSQEADDNNENRWDAINEQRVEFFNQRLNLTQPETDEFWLVYNRYWERKMSIVNARREALKQCSQNIEKFSDSEIERQSEQYINFKLQEYELMKDYHDEFLKVLTPSKVLLLYVLDNEFKSYLIRGMKKGSVD